MSARENRTLVLAAFPAEADAVLSHTTLDPDPRVVADRRHFYLGAIGGRKVVVAMTGIGLVNAAHTTETAFAHFAVAAVLFSGVAGGGAGPQIGDVAIPARWTTDGGATFSPVDPALLATAQTLEVGMGGADSLGRRPRLVVGGDGFSVDGNNGTEFPGIPFGGSVFGCQPRDVPYRSPLYTGNFFRAIGPWLARGLVGNLRLAAQDPAFDAQDMETAAAQRVADAHGVPFLGIRGISDGRGDLRNLPGFPVTFFVYKRIAADNAATATAALLRNWAGP